MAPLVDIFVAVKVIVPVALSWCSTTVRNCLGSIGKSQIADEQIAKKGCGGARRDGGVLRFSLSDGVMRMCGYGGAAVGDGLGSDGSRVDVMLAMLAH